MESTQLKIQINKFQRHQQQQNMESIQLKIQINKFQEHQQNMETSPQFSITHNLHAQNKTK